MKVKIRKNSKKKQRVNVRIDDHDLWNLDRTLAFIILPALKKFRKNLVGSSWVDNEDVPDHLKSDTKYHRKWKYVLDEMIWAFKQIVHENEGDLFFFTDKEQYNVHVQRIANGLRLFGKYYTGLWQ